MAITAKYPGHIVIADDPQNIIFGTAQVGQEFGEVKSATVKRTADQEELSKRLGNLKACVLRNPRFELSLDVLFTDEKTAPGLGEAIAFPLADIVGRILDVEVMWEDSSGRMLKIEATSWDSLGNDGAGSAEHFTGAAFVPVVNTVEPDFSADPVAPTLVSATVLTTGDAIELVFDQPVVVNAANNGLTYEISTDPGVDYELDYFSGSGSTLIVVTPQSVILSGVGVNVEYEAGANRIANTSGTPMAAVIEVATNNSSVA